MAKLTYGNRVGLQNQETRHRRPTMSLSRAPTVATVATVPTAEPGSFPFPVRLNTRHFRPPGSDDDMQIERKP